MEGKHGRNVAALLSIDARSAMNVLLEFLP
jgi:hypothetical protein